MYISTFELGTEGFGGTVADSSADLSRSVIDNFVSESTGKILTGSFDTTDPNEPVANPVIRAEDGVLIFANE